MKILYATSITLPSRHANRRQVLSMAKALYALLGDDFLLGMGANDEHAVIGAPMIEMGRGLRSFVLAWKYVRCIRERAITHVYTREDRLFFFLRLYTRLLRLPVRIYFEAHAFSREFFFIYAVAHADGVVALTKALQEDSASLKKSARSMVAPDAVEAGRFSLKTSKEEARERFGIPRGRTLVAYIGRYNTLGQEDKGVANFIHSFARASGHAPLYLLLVGLAPSELPDVEVFCEECGIGETMRTLVPYAPQEEVALAMRAADMLIMNYPNLPHFARHMSPMKLFEYMASRTPIITTDLPSVREIVSDEDVFFVPPGDVPALSEMLVFLAGHKEEGARKAERAYEKVKGYTWENRAATILAFIKA